jgi:putative tryptophan/tyrosine transport system substrate-binding protein
LANLNQWGSRSAQLTPPYSTRIAQTSADVKPIRVSSQSMTPIRAGRFCAHALAVWLLSLSACALAAPCGSTAKRQILMTDLASRGERSAYAELLRRMTKSGVLQKHCAELLLEPLEVGGVVDPIEAARSAFARRPDMLLLVDPKQVVALPQFPTRTPKIIMAWDETAVRPMLNRPAQNAYHFTGYVLSNNVAAKMLEVTQKAFGGARHIAVVGLQDDQAASTRLATIECADCEFHQVEWQQGQLVSPTRSLQSIDAWWVMHTRVTQDHRAAIFNTLARYRKPVIAARTASLEHGAWVTVQADLGDWIDIWERQIDAVLSGVPIASIPLEYPRGIKTHINPKPWREAGLTIPRWLIHRADVVP